MCSSIRKGIRFLLARNFFIWLPDESYLKLKYWACIGKKLNLKNPQTFNEKLQWLKLNDRQREYTMMVDKYEAKKYVSDIIGEEYIIPTLGVWDRFEDIDFSTLPDQFVLKTTHDSGGVVICRDKNSFDTENARKIINKSMGRNYFYSGREWPYKNVVPRIIGEKYLCKLGESGIVDYKIMCFGGKAKCIFACTGRYTPSGLKITVFDTDWNRIPFERDHHPSEKNTVSPPESLKRMIEISERISKDIPFVRIDFYEIDGSPYFGEITFFPASGFGSFSPEEWDKTLGDWINLFIVKGNLS